MGQQLLLRWAWLMAAAVAWVPNKTSGRHAIEPQGGPAGYGEGKAHGKI